MQKDLVLPSSIPSHLIHLICKLPIIMVYATAEEVIVTWAQMVSNCFTVSSSSTALVLASSRSSEIPWNNFFHWESTLRNASPVDQYRLKLSIDSVHLIHCTYEHIAYTPQETFLIHVSLQLRIVFFTSHKFAAVTVWEVKLKPPGIKKTITASLWI